MDENINFIQDNPISKSILKSLTIADICSLSIVNKQLSKELRWIIEKLPKNSDISIPKDDLHIKFPLKILSVHSVLLTLTLIIMVYKIEMNKQDNTFIMNEYVDNIMNIIMNDAPKELDFFDIIACTEWINNDNKKIIYLGIINDIYCKIINNPSTATNIKSTIDNYSPIISYNFREGIILILRINIEKYNDNRCYDFIKFSIENIKYTNFRGRIVKNTLLEKIEDYR